MIACEARAVAIAALALAIGYELGRRSSCGSHSTAHSISKVIDLSVPIKRGIPSDPPQLLPQVDYTLHDEGAVQMASFFPGLLASQLPGMDGWALETLKLTTHAGTHVDAPWHYSATDASGKRSLMMHELPLEQFIGPGVKLDFRHFPDGHVVSADEVKAELARIDHVLRPGDIVLVNTAASTRYGEEDYLVRGCGLGREATNFLTGQGVRTMGTDAWSWDAPFKFTAQKWRETQDASIIWEGHKAGRERPYAQIEKLANLESLPGHKFTVAVFPVLIHNASAGWTRAVAFW
eukprot:TRINITY_DN111456_c0_g1_i1.p1 TRINITY_DN111456_c0_g1~~TRINITY_DN111456_c0_g1_i1.p1  ORF type:complete len:292 (+),score=32.30 TRINITY_DN111456_c0_g1_i1:184-1059(+)